MKKGLLITLAIVVLLVLIVGGWLKGTYNGLVTEQQNVESKWSQVENVYQRRADLIPNLVATVKGYASHEKETLEAVTASRSQVGSIKMTPEMLNDPTAMKKFEQAQAVLDSPHSLPLPETGGVR